MNAQFQAIYLPVLAAFVAGQDDIRYHIRGFLIEPAPAHIGGVYLVATDGHTAVVIHDLKGSSDGIYIMPVPRHMMPLCDKAKDRTLHFNGIRVDIRGRDNCHILAEPCKPIDGSFPNWRRAVVPELPIMAYPVNTLAGSIVVNPQYMARCSHATLLLYSGSADKTLEIFPAHKGDQVVVVPQIPEGHRIYFVIMHMTRHGLEPKRMDWIGSLGERWEDPGRPWTNWNGHVMEFEGMTDDTVVEVKLRNGKTTTSRAGNFNWTQVGSDTDIVAYRKPTTTPEKGA